MKILFLCTGNTCRSPMAEGIFNARYSGNGVSCKSAGIYAVTGMPPSEYAILACRAIDIDISSQRSLSLEDINLKDYDIYAVMTESHGDMLGILGVNKDKIYILGNGISDPYGGSFEDYCLCRDEIISAIEKLIRDKEI